MTKKEFFPPRPTTNPTIYAYELMDVATHKGLLKIGYTDRDAQTRIKEQLGTAAIPYKIVFEESAMKRDGSSFTDHEVHRLLREWKVVNESGEWFKCTLNDLRRAIHQIKTGEKSEANRVLTFGMRPEQEAAVNKSIAYFKSFKKENKDRTPHFLWNAKMRFGKTFASYQLAKKMGWKKVLVLTFKPAVEDAWKEDLLSHVDFKGWQFISKHADELSSQDIDTKKPLVCFGSFQDFLGKNTNTGGIKAKNEWVHATVWDCIIFDEYHFGAWRESAKDLFGKDLEAEKEIEEYKKIEKEGIAEEDKAEHLEKIIPISTNHYLYLSGTPFRAISSGEFIEEQIFNWTYSDEQREKENWDNSKGSNPYAALPRMVMLTYQLPDSIRQIAMQGEFDGFDLNIFFSAEGEETPIAHLVPKAELAKNGDFNLSGERYKVFDALNSVYELVELGEVTNLYQPQTISQKDMVEDGQYLVFGANGVIGKYDQYNHEDREVLITCRGATCGTINMSTPKAWITGNAMVAQPIDDKTLNKDFLFFLLSNSDLSSTISGAAQPQITRQGLSPFKIPLPPLSIQEEIVAEIEGYQKIIDGAKAVVGNYKPKIDIDPDWEMVELDSIADVISGNAFSSSDFKDDNPIRCIKITNVGVREFVNDDTGRLPESFISQYSRFAVKSGDLVISLTRTIISSGLKVAIVPESWDNTLVNQRVAGIKPTEKSNILFIYYYLCSDAVFRYVEDKSRSLMQPNLSITDLKNLSIPCPSIDIQNEIVSQIEREQELVNANKVLIEIFEQKIKDRIAKVWGE